MFCASSFDMGFTPVKSDYAEILGHLLQILGVDVREAVPGGRHQTLGALVYHLVDVVVVNAPQIGVLVEIVLEPVILEQLLVIRRVVGVGVKRLELVSLDQQSPPRIARTEVHGTVHSLHAAAGEPQARRVEEHVGELLIVYGLEKAATARRLLVRVGVLVVIERRDAAHHFARAVVRYPADHLAVGEEFVFGGIEYRQNIVVQRAYPIAVAFVDPIGQVDELAFEGLVGHLFESVLRVAHNMFMSYSVFPSRRSVSARAALRSAPRPGDMRPPDAVGNRMRRKDNHFFSITGKTR